MNGDRAAAAPTASGTPGSSPDEVVRWRLRALDQQLPAASFPAGSNAPSLVYLWATMVVAAVAVLGFAIHDRQGVPIAVQDSQRDLMAKVARSGNATLTRVVEEFDRFAARLRQEAAPIDEKAVGRLVTERPLWAGAAVIEIASRRSVLATGVPVPLDLLPPALRTPRRSSWRPPTGPRWSVPRSWTRAACSSACIPSPCETSGSTRTPSTGCS